MEHFLWTQKSTYTYSFHQGLKTVRTYGQIYSHIHKSDVCFHSKPQININAYTVWT